MAHDRSIAPLPSKQSRISFLPTVIALLAMLLLLDILPEGGERAAGVGLVVVGIAIGLLIKDERVSDYRWIPIVTSVPLAVGDISWALFSVAFAAVGFGFVVTTAWGARRRPEVRARRRWWYALGLVFLTMPIPLMVAERLLDRSDGIWVCLSALPLALWVSALIPITIQAMTFPDSFGAESTEFGEVNRRLLTEMEDIQRDLIRFAMPVLFLASSVATWFALYRLQPDFRWKAGCVLLACGMAWSWRLRHDRRDWLRWASLGIAFGAVMPAAAFLTWPAPLWIAMGTSLLFVLDLVLAATGRPGRWSIVPVNSWNEAFLATAAPLGVIVGFISVAI